jgi:hypothetical protein
LRNVGPGDQEVGYPAPTGIAPQVGAPGRVDRWLPRACGDRPGLTRRGTLVNAGYPTQSGMGL